MKLPQWQSGRQGTGYDVLTLINNKLLKFDLHILRYKPGSHIPPHKDPALEGYEHHRLNIVLKKSRSGGEFAMNRKLRTGRFHYFRPDLYMHAVTKVKFGTRYVLSIGWLRKAKQ